MCAETKSRISKILIGKNGSGKTRSLEEINKKLNDEGNDFLTFYIPTDQNLIEETTKNAESAGRLGVQKEGSFLYQFDNLVKEFLLKDDDSIIKLSKEKEEKYNETLTKKKERLDELLKPPENDNDYVLDSLKNDITLNKNLELFNLKKLKDHSKKRKPSGQLFYSIVRLISSFLSSEEIRSKKKLENVYLIIDEPEKFCHPNLIRKISLHLKEINKYMNIILSTHSPLFLSYFISEPTKIYRMDEDDYEDQQAKNEEKLDIETVIENIIKKKGIDLNESLSNVEKFLEEDDWMIDENNRKEFNLVNRFESFKNMILNNKINRINFFESFFCDTIVLVEGIVDKVLINRIIYEPELLKDLGIPVINQNSNFYVFDCFGKYWMIFFMKLMELLNFKNLKVVIDSDLDIENHKKINLKIEEMLKEIKSENLFKFRHNIEKEFGIEINKKDQWTKTFPNWVFDNSKLKNKKDSIKKIIEFLKK